MLKAKSMCDFFFLGGGVRKYITCVGRLVVVYQCVCKDRKAVRRKQGAPADGSYFVWSLWTGEADTWVVLGVAVRGLNARVILCIALTVAGLDS